MFARVQPLLERPCCSVG